VVPSPDYSAEGACSDADACDEQIERDAAAGSLDFLVEEARDEKRRGKLREL